MHYSYIKPTINADTNRAEISNMEDKLMHLGLGPFLRDYVQEEDKRRFSFVVCGALNYNNVQVVEETCGSPNKTLTKVNVQARSILGPRFLGRVVRSLQRMLRDEGYTRSM